MSISSEITRISGNVSAALTAIGNKGVTVPAGSNSDDLATLIASIQTGGGGGVSRTVIAAEQTVTASEYFTALSGTEGLTEGNVYAYTVDGTEYVGMAVTNSGMLYVNSGFTYAIGDYGGSLYLVTQSTGQHTVKVEELDLSGGGSGTNQDYEDSLTAFGVQSNLASSITALTTYANSVTGESDTNLSDAVRTLADGYGSSGGVKTASGTFTVGNSTYITSKQIAHNLGTTRLFGMIWKEADANDQVVAARGYDLIFGHFITHSFINDLYSGKTIVTDYTSASTKTAAHTDETNPYLRRYKSNWSNKAASWTSDTSNVVNQVWGKAVDSNTINIQTNSNNTYMGTGTYHWQVWALDNWVND